MLVVRIFVFFLGLVSASLPVLADCEDDYHSCTSDRCNQGMASTINGLGSIFAAASGSAAGLAQAQRQQQEVDRCVNQCQTQRNSCQAFEQQQEAQRQQLEQNRLLLQQQQQQQQPQQRPQATTNSAHDARAEKAEIWLADAFDHFKAKRYQEAADHFSAGLEVLPDNATGHYWAMINAEAMKDSTLARRHAVRFLQLEPTDPKSAGIRRRYPSIDAVAAKGAVVVPGSSSTSTLQPALIRWRLASSFPKAIDTIFASAELLAKRVDELTAGKFKISVHAAGELMPSSLVVDGLQKQTIEMAHTFPFYFYRRDPAWSFGSGLAFAVNGIERDAWQESDAGSVAWQQFLAKQGLRSWRLGDATGKARDLPLTSAWWCTKPVRTLEDLKGLKVRVGVDDGKVWERLGVIPQNIPGGDVYLALQNGTLDCAAWISPYDDEKLGFFKVAPYYVYAPGFRVRAQTALLVSEAAWANLPPSYRTALEQAVLEVAPEMERTYLQKNESALSRLVSKGAKLISLEPALLRAAERAAKEQWAQDASASSEFSILWSSWTRASPR